MGLRLGQNASLTLNNNNHRIKNLHAKIGGPVVSIENKFSGTLAQPVI